MSPKIKMSDIHDERDDDIIELSDEELKEIYPMTILMTAKNTEKSILLFSPILTPMPRWSPVPMTPPSAMFPLMKMAIS